MALPVIKTAPDCSDFARTVTPFFHQLRPLPSIIVESISNPAALKQIYLDTNPLISALAFSIALAPLFLILSEANKNYSQVDRLWSILPTIYNAHYVIYGHLMGFETKRLDTLLAASCIWSVSAFGNPSNFQSLNMLSFRRVSRLIIGGREDTPSAARIIVGKSSGARSRLRCFSSSMSSSSLSRSLCCSSPSLPRPTSFFSPHALPPVPAVRSSRGPPPTLYYLGC